MTPRPTSRAIEEAARAMYAANSGFHSMLAHREGRTASVTPHPDWADAPQYHQDLYRARAEAALNFALSVPLIDADTCQFLVVRAHPDERPGLLGDIEGTWYEKGPALARGRGRQFAVKPGRNIQISNATDRVECNDAGQWAQVYEVRA